MSKTKEVVQQMLAQPVRSMTDSGDFYGRAYDKYVNVDWDKIPPATFTAEDGFTRSLYHHLMSVKKTFKYSLNTNAQVLIQTKK